MERYQIGHVSQWETERKDLYFRLMHFISETTFNAPNLFRLSPFDSFTLPEGILWNQEFRTPKQKS